MMEQRCLLSVIRAGKTAIQCPCLRHNSFQRNHHARRRKYVSPHQPETQTFVTVQTEKAGLILVNPNKQLFRNTLCLVCTYVAQVQPNTFFKIIIANIGQNQTTLNVVQTVTVAVERRISSVERPITHGEVLRIAVEKLYLKRPSVAKAEEVINASLSNNR